MVRLSLFVCAATTEPTSAQFVWSGIGSFATAATNFAFDTYVSSPDFNLAGTNPDSWQDKLGNAATQQDATWEFAFRPGDFTGSHHLFNTGGNGDGTAFLLNGDTLEFRFQDNSTAAQRVFMSHQLTGDSDEFYHVVGTADVESLAAGIGVLYVNGELVDGPLTSTGTIDDWDGGDLANLGGASESFNIPGGTSVAFDAFNGDIAFFRYYQDTIFDQGQVDEAFAALAVPEPASIAIWSIIGLGMFGFGYRKLRRKK